MNGASKIRASHRARRAVVYVRQSTVVQTRLNTESTARQYGLADVAVGFGWPREAVTVVDADLGVSGRFGSQRAGFAELVSLVCLGEVGAVFGLEVSRLARSSAEFARLLELAKLTDTLLVDADGVYDLSDVNDRLLLGLKGTMSEAELHLLLGRLHGSKLAAAQRGDLRSPLPIGYVYAENEIAIDPDEEVAAAVADLFTAFAATGSAYQVSRAFADRKFPLRAYGGAWAGRLRWGKLNHARVVDLITNPCYAGAYVFGRSYERRTVRPDGTVRTARKYRPRAEWPVVIHDHHAGYITWHQFLDNEARLAANNTAKKARPPREGAPLCQGIVHCGSCGYWRSTQYHWEKFAIYGCGPARREGAETPGCRSVNAAMVDDAVVKLLLAVVEPEQIRLALAAADEVAARHTRSHRAAELALDRARYEADRAERAFSNVEPENRLVARTLEARWEAKLAALSEAEAALETAKAATPPIPDRDALLALAGDLPALWHAEQTSNRDRKRLLRALIADVTILCDPADPDTFRVGVRWRTGATDEVTLQRPGPGKTSPEAMAIFREHGPTVTSRQLADKLNAAGLTTGKNKPWTAASVNRIRHVHGIVGPRNVPPAQGEVSVLAVAGHFGIARHAIYEWLAKGQVPGRRTTGGWRIPWNPETEAAYQAHIDASFRVQRGTRTPIPGDGV